MLDINFVKENQDLVKKGTKDKGYDPAIVDRVLKVDEARRDLIGKIETLRAERNKLTKYDVEKGKKVKEELRKLEPGLNVKEKELKDLLYQIPNLPAADVPFGKDETENIEIKKWGKPKKFSFQPKSYQELGDLLEIIDIKTASKVSGTRFGYIKNEAALLEFALVQLAFDTLVKEGFIPVIPPALINLDITKKLGYWDAGGNESYYLVHETEKEKKAEEFHFYLIGTAEHSLVPMHKDEILSEKKLPLRYAGFSSCFRREAGSYGKDTQGIFRVHQFDKVEMVSFIKSQEKDDLKENEYLLSLEEKIVQALEIPYQVTKMCTGDLGHPAARKFDLNCWFPSEKRYRETHSVSTCTDYQARRLNTRYRNGDKNDFVHILNGTAIAIGRMILAILENHQQKDGTVEIPKVLQKYTGFKKIAPKR
jgi:seryl-tRNA synthetase